MSAEQQRFMRTVVDQLFTPPTKEEITRVVSLYQSIDPVIETDEGDVIVFTFTTPYGNIRAAVGLDRGRIVNTRGVWYNGGIPGLPPKPSGERTLSDYVRKQLQIGTPIVLIEPNAVLETESSDFLQSTLSNQLGKNLAAVAALKILRDRSVVTPNGPKLHVGGYSGGADTGLTLAANGNDVIGSVSVGSGYSNLLSPSLESKAINIIDQNGSWNWFSAFAGNQFFADSLATGLSNEANQRAFIQNQTSRMRELMILSSPYYQMSTIPVNSMILTLSHGRNDELVPVEQTEELEAYLRGLGWDDNHLRVIYHNGNHFVGADGQFVNPDEYIRIPSEQTSLIPGIEPRVFESTQPGPEPRLVNQQGQPVPSSNLLARIREGLRGLLLPEYQRYGPAIFYRDASTNRLMVVPIDKRAGRVRRYYGFYYPLLGDGRRIA